MAGAASWKRLRVPEVKRLPRDVVVRAERLPARHAFPEHAHAWHQLVYAIEGVLVVSVEGRRFVVPPRQAVWIPTGTAHRVGAWFGAEFRSLYVADRANLGMPADCTVLDVTPLMKALILEAADAGRRGEAADYLARVKQLALDQLRRLPRRGLELPWPSDRRLRVICETLYASPDDARGIAQWGVALGASARTLSRRFARETGMSLRDWRRRLRLFKAIELLGAGHDVTRTALELGYASTSAFSYMFRVAMGRSPTAYLDAARASTG